MSKEYLLSKMLWPEVQEVLQETDTALIPVGSTEQHGLHLPVDNDHYTAYEISRLVAERLAGKMKLVVCPVMPYGVSPHHMGFPGTISLRTETFVNVMKDVCRSLIRHGFRKLLIINGHGGNVAALHAVISDLKLETEAYIYLINWWELASDVIQKTCGHPVFHACETETSMALALNQRVEIDKAKDEVPKTEAAFVKYDLFGAPPRVGAGVPDLREITKSGTIGCPTKAGEDKGRIILNAVMERICSFLKQLEELEQSS